MKRATSNVLAILCAILITACATSPEQKLLTGYQTASKVVTTTTILLDRDQLSSEDGERVLKAGLISKAALDAGKAALSTCRATDPKAKCDGAVADIDMGAGLLLELEKYLEKKQ